MSKIKLKDLLFFVGYSIILFSDMFSAVLSLSSIVNVIDYIGLGILLLVIILYAIDEKYSYKKILGILLVMIILLFTKLSSGDNLLLKFFVIVLAFKNIDFQKFIKYDFYLRIFFMIIVTLFYKNGLTSVYTIYRENGLVRSSMGFAHPNNFGQYILIICIDYIFLKFRSFKIRNCILPMFGIYLIYTFSNSRTSIFCLFILLLLVFFQKCIPDILNKRFIKRICLHVFLFFTVLSVALAWGYKMNDPLAIRINSTLSNRLFYSSSFLRHYDVTLFGNEIQMVYTQEARSTGRQPWTLDNSYLVFLLRYGILAYIVVAMMSRKMLLKFYGIERYDVIIMWLIFSLNGIFENYLFKIHFNPFLVIFSILVYKDIQNWKQLQ